jgi:hypothetical protein
MNCSVRWLILGPPELIKESSFVNSIHSSAVEFPVWRQDRVGGDEKGSLKSDTVKYGRESQGTRTKGRLRWQGPAAYIKDRPVLSSERAPHKNKTVTVTQVIKIWS